MNRSPAILPAQPKVVGFDKLSPKQRAAFATPKGFARAYLGMNLTPKQEAVLDSMAPTGAHVSGLFPNEGGKTTRVIPAFILWHLTVFRRRGENGGVTTTSGSWGQIENQLVPALKSHAHRFPKWDFNDAEIKIDGIPNWMAYSTLQPGRAEGFHGHAEHPLACLVDESKSVRDGIFKAIEERCHPQRVGYFSSAGYSMGTFFESQNGNRRFYSCHKMTVEDCPWIDRGEMERLILKAGGGDREKGLLDPLIRAAYFSEFMPFVEGGLLSMADIEECLADPPKQMHGGRHVFCDFAAGGDENVLAVRNGNRVWIQDAWRDKNTMSAVGRFIVGFQKLKKEIGLRAQEIEGDADGMGKPVCDRIREAGWDILDFHGGAAAHDGSRFKNRVSECWFTGADGITERKLIIPDDAEMKAQMLDRQARYDSSGLRWLESKDDLFRRQGKETRPKRSPDRADAVFGAAAGLPVLQGVNLIRGAEQAGPWANDPDMGGVHEEAGVPEEILRGFDAGG